MGKSKSKSRSSKGRDSSGGGNGTLSIDPLGIYFTHSKIRPFFTGCGKRIEDTLSEIREGVTLATTLPLITIIPDTNGNYYSLNNRRLYVLKQLKREGIVDTVTVRLKQPLEREKVRYTPERCSLHCSIMKEKEMEHKEKEMESVGEIDGEKEMEGGGDKDSDNHDDQKEDANEEGEEQEEGEGEGEGEGEEEEEEELEGKACNAFSVFSLNSDSSEDSS